MNDRERFIAAMQGKPRDRSPIMDFSFWEETLVVWREQGLPPEVGLVNTDAYFGMDGLEQYSIGQRGTATFTRKDKPAGRLGVEVGLFPTFDERVIEDRGEEEVVQQADGVRVLRRKFTSSIPVHDSHLLVDRETWRRHYKPRLDPTSPERLPPATSPEIDDWCDSDRDHILYLPGGSLYGWIRNWMGIEMVSYVIYDDAAWFEEMVETIADCIIGVLERILETGGQFDACGMWEDMCFKTGPLLPPAHFKRVLVPHYKRITGLLRDHGVDIVWLDCDGKIDELIPLWLDAGVNCMMPIEIGTWDADPVRYRKEFGPDLLMMGGFDKHILAGTAKEIEDEVNRLAPLVEEGGYIGYCDHRVPPDVPLANYRVYLDAVRSVWGKGVNLKPMGVLPARAG